MKASKYSNLTVLVIIAALVALMYILFTTPIEQYDTKSYIRAWSNWGNGILDPTRTPLYPAIVGLSIDLAGRAMGLRLVCILQWVMSIVALVCAWRTMRMCGIGSKLAFWVILLLWVMTPMCREYHNTLMTESLSMSFGLIISYTCIKSLSSRRYGYVVVTGLLCLSMIALRPGSVYLLPVIGLFYLFIGLWRNRSVGFVGVVCVVAVSIAVLYYNHCMERRYGVFSPTMVSVNNRYQCARGAGLVLPGEIRNGMVKVGLSDSIRQHGEVMGYNMSWDNYHILINERNYVLERIGHEGLDEIVTDAMKRHPLKALYAVFARLKAMSMISFAKVINTFYVFILLAVSICAAFLICRKLKRPHDYPLFSILVAVLPLSQFLVNAISGPNDFERLNLPALPFVIIVVAQILNWFRFRDIRLE